MKPITRFGMEKHDGPYETWPLRSRVSLDGKPTDISLPGYTLLHQFETANGYILVTDYDCPYEEITSFALISKQLRLQSCRWLVGCTKHSCSSASNGSTIELSRPSFVATCVAGSRFDPGGSRTSGPV